ncbi:PEP-CTERM sorting domain-containing protein [Paraglaciecola aquimarina]|uniref:PEP-CTERM sorting domain-containing protein n=1 Tax=Paraglaciecola aquimarina TaxID=1235557 RepID=A0ABU3SV64_9ALTE|nr:PEP-CTERM sorting domain-containing protein [Paraglaciecola aquimarina]MDU0353884.1 PEP-CTERM sorting domain-containing protein [Paraglaciecola aquimarina]
MNSIIKKLTISTLVTSGLSLSLLSSSVSAGAIIKYGDTYLGVNNEGHLNIRANDEDLSIPAGFVGPMEDSAFEGMDIRDIPIGLYRNGVGDSTSPDCLCEGWGIAATTDGNRVSGFASIDNGGGIGGLTGGTFGSTSSTATSEVNLSDADISITHAFGPSLAEGVFQVSVSILNNTGATISDLVYRRAMDWDIPPDEFNEFVTHGGIEANLESVGGNIRYASDNGFADVDPTTHADFINPETVNSDFVDNGPSDHGSVFDFTFGDLANGESRTFNIFYGSTANEAEAMAAIDTLGVNAYSLGQYSGGADSEDGEFDCDGPCLASEDGSPIVARTLASTSDTSIGDNEIGGPDSGEPATFLFAFGGVGGVEPGSSEDVPILPFVTAPGEFVFTSPEPRNWYDPPYADGFEYALEGGATFTSVTLPSAGLGFGNVDVVIDGVVVATLTSDDALDGGIDTYTFAPGVSTFSLVGLDTVLDIAAPDFGTAFPVFLDFSGNADLLTQTSLIIDDTTPPTGVPAPSSLLLLALGFALIGVRKYKKA